MNVLFVQQQPCIRALKYARGFKDLKLDINIVFCYTGKTFSGIYGQGDEMVDEWIRLDNDPATTLQETVERYQIRLIHCHNAPDSLTNLCIDLFKGRVPVVHDIHDLMSARNTVYEDGVENGLSTRNWKQEEKRAIEKSDAVIAVSDEIFSQARQLSYRIADNSHVYPNYIPTRFVPDHGNVWEPNGLDRPVRIVYEGFVSATKDSHYYFVDIFKELAGTGLEVHIYPSRENKIYKDLAKSNKLIYCHDSLPPEKLFMELPKYDLGWCGFNDKVNTRHMDTVLPNKFFEYIACGLPVISFPHKSLKEIIEKRGLGIVVESALQTVEGIQMADWSHIRQQVGNAKYDFTVESNIPDIIALYNKLTDKRMTAEPSMDATGLACPV